MVWKKILTGLSSPRKKTKTIPKDMINIHLVLFETETDGMVVIGVTLGAS